MSSVMGNAGDCGIAGKRDHRVAVAAENECSNILDAHIQFRSNECAEAR